MVTERDNGPPEPDENTGPDAAADTKRLAEEVERLRRQVREHLEKLERHAGRSRAAKAEVGGDQGPEPQGK